MGYFTWTDANKKPRETVNGYDYWPSCKIPYGGRAVVVCPDDTEIVEEYYDGYGIFGGKDVYELVVDWNREHLTEIFDYLDRTYGDYWGKKYRGWAEAYQRGEIPDTDDKEWKREVGIAIACEYNDRIPYPIKITCAKRHKKYADLLPSISTQ